MKTLRPPAILLAVLCVAFLAYMGFTVPNLPGRLAVHFGADGTANGWMTRSTHLTFMIGVGLGVPLIFALIALAIRFMPAQSFNIPHRDYWLSPERKTQTCAYISRQLLWLACLEVLFFVGIQYLMIRANREVPVHLPMMPFLAMLGVFLVAVLVNIVRLVTHFSRTA